MVTMENLEYGRRQLPRFGIRRLNMVFPMFNKYCLQWIRLKNCSSACTETHTSTHMATHRHTHQNKQKEKMQHVHLFITALIFKIRQIKVPSVKTLSPYTMCHLSLFHTCSLISPCGEGCYHFPIHFIRSKKLDWGRQSLIFMLKINVCTGWS